AERLNLCSHCEFDSSRLCCSSCSRLAKMSRCYRGVSDPGRLDQRRSRIVEPCRWIAAQPCLAAPSPNSQEITDTSNPCNPTSTTARCLQLLQRRHVFLPHPVSERTVWRSTARTRVSTHRGIATIADRHWTSRLATSTRADRIRCCGTSRSVRPTIPDS